jgi:hypothetical protein
VNLKLTFQENETMKKLMTLLTIVCLGIFVAGCAEDTATEDTDSTDLGTAAETPSGDMDDDHADHADSDNGDADSDNGDADSDKGDAEKEGETKEGDDE